MPRLCLGLEFGFACFESFDSLEAPDSPYGILRNYQIKLFVCYLTECQELRSFEAPSPDCYDA
jgi:hypothetical protein